MVQSQQQTQPVDTRRIGSLPALALLLLASGCASVDGHRNPNDPLEPYNRAMFRFNDSVDRAVLKPVAQGYDKVVPDLVKIGVRNIFNNLDDIKVVFNDVLQGKGAQALDDFARLFLNTTVGMLGLFDVARQAGLEKHSEDFGQTLGRWGVASGPYFVLPLLGPSTIRDTGGLATLDRPLSPRFNIDHVPTRNTIFAADIVSTRASLLGVSSVLEEAALDQYNFVRDGWLKRRQNQVYDGNPPKEKDEEEEEEDLDPEKHGELPGVTRATWPEYQDNLAYQAQPAKKQGLADGKPGEHARAAWAIACCEPEKPAAGAIRSAQLDLHSPLRF